MLVVHTMYSLDMSSNGNKKKVTKYKFPSRVAHTIGIEPTNAHRL